MLPGEARYSHLVLLLPICASRRETITAIRGCIAATRRNNSHLCEYLNIASTMRPMVDGAQASRPIAHAEIYGHYAQNNDGYRR